MAKEAKPEAATVAAGAPRKSKKLLIIIAAAVLVLVLAGGGAAYFLLEGLARLIVETWRGDLDRGVWFGLSWLSTGRLTALGFIAFGLLLWACFSRRKPAVEAEAGKA